MAHIIMVEYKNYPCVVSKLKDNKEIHGISVCTVYLLIYRTAKNNNFGNCPGIIGTDFYRACEVSGIISSCLQAS